MEPAAGDSDKAVLTLGDNRQVDFSRAMIFMTSNLGAREMAALDRRGWALPRRRRRSGREHPHGARRRGGRAAQVSRPSS